MSTPLAAPTINIEGPTPTRDSSDDASLLGAREKRAASRRVTYNTKADSKKWPSYGNGPDIVCEQAGTPTSAAFNIPSPEVASPVIPDTPIPGAGLPDRHWPDHVKPRLSSTPSIASFSSSASSSRRSSRIYTPSPGKTYEERVAPRSFPGLSVTVPVRQSKFGPPLRVNPQSPAPVADRTSYAAQARIEPPPAYDPGSYTGHYAKDAAAAEKAAPHHDDAAAGSPWNPLATAISMRSEPLDTPNANALLNEKYYSGPRGTTKRAPMTKRRKIVVSLVLAVLIMLVLAGIGYAVAMEIKEPDMSSRLPDHYDDESTVGWVLVPTDPKMLPKPVSKRWLS